MNKKHLFFSIFVCSSKLVDMQKLIDSLRGYLKIIFLVNFLIKHVNLFKIVNYKLKEINWIVTCIPTAGLSLAKLCTLTVSLIFLHLCHCLYLLLHFKWNYSMFTFRLNFISWSLCLFPFKPNQLFGAKINCVFDVVLHWLCNSKFIFNFLFFESFLFFLLLNNDFDPLIGG